MRIAVVVAVVVIPKNSNRLLLLLPVCILVLVIEVGIGKHLKINSKAVQVLAAVVIPAVPPPPGCFQRVCFLLEWLLFLPPSVGRFNEVDGMATFVAPDFLLPTPAAGNNRLRG
jgi:hypothetical protein